MRSKSPRHGQQQLDALGLLVARPPSRLDLGLPDDVSKEEPPSVTSDDLAWPRPGGQLILQRRHAHSCDMTVPVYTTADRRDVRWGWEFFWDSRVKLFDPKVADNCV